MWAVAVLTLYRASLLRKAPGLSYLSIRYPFRAVIMGSSCLSCARLLTCRGRKQPAAAHARGVPKPQRDRVVQMIVMAEHSKQESKGGLHDFVREGTSFLDAAENHQLSIVEVLLAAGNGVAGDPNQALFRLSEAPRE